MNTTTAFEEVPECTMAKVWRKSHLKSAFRCRRTQGGAQAFAQYSVSFWW